MPAMAPDAARDLGFDLSGEVALITGAAGGLGAAIARGLARVGARVALADLATPGLDAVRESIAALGAETLAHPLDVARAVDVGAAVERIVATWGRLDILVNCAGITRRQPALDF